jgi:hypothetical protein
MRGFRQQVRQGSLLALLALAINLALSFGHIHFDTARGERATASLLLSAILHDDDGQKGKVDGHPDEFCPICVARAALGTAMVATPPSLPVEFVSATIEHSNALQVALIEPRRLAFYSRGPPLS